MINIKIEQNFTFEDIKPAINKSLRQSVLLVEWKAKINAPVLSWDLKWGINWNLKQISSWIWIISTSDSQPYARIREYVNKKNPHKKFYMKRALESSEKEIYEFFTKNILNMITKKK